jgi:putative ATP-binding cassette transporter
VIFPFLAAAPRYFAKAIKLGDLMQISSAFGRVQEALSYFIGAYTSLAGWRAVMDRLYGFQVSINEAKELTGLTVEFGTNYLQLSNININLPSGKSLVNGVNLTLNQGDTLLIKGRSGSGKTTLLRTIAGLWHFADGNISQKPNLNSLFIAQKPYLTIGKLKEAICYPLTDNLPNDHEIQKLLAIFNLDHLANRLEEHADWTNMLSVGEQQRIAICRILINKPDIIYLDEATSALDEEMEAITYNTIRSQLPNSVIVSVGHRSTITKWHDQVLDFNSLVA